MNHAFFEQRIEFIRVTILQRYGLKTSAIDPIEYNPECIFPYNNFVYRVELSRSSPPSSENQQGLDLPVATQPGTISIPQATRHVVMRLSNAAAGLNNLNRVQNEVAAMSLARGALAPLQIVPAVYGWASAANGQGWIMMEHMRGTSLDAEFEEMSEDDKSKILHQIANIFLAIQQYELPKSIRGFGGLNFDRDGDIISAPLTVFSCGPFTTYAEMVKGILSEQLTTASKSPILRGWTARGIQARLERFIVNDVDRMLQGIDTERKRLFHGDFTMNNFLYDTESRQVTAIIDFDWAQIALAADEALRSFHKRYARLPSAYEQDSDRVLLRHALLHGTFPSPLPASSRSVMWDTAEMWDRKLADIGADRPSTFQGIETLSRLYMLLDMICPDMLCNEVIVEQRNKESMEQEKEATEKLLEKFLHENKT